MRRRHFLAAAGAAAGSAATLKLARPAIAAPASVIRFVPNVGLPVLDPIANTTAQVRTHACLIFDTLFGLDENYLPHPQMLRAAGTDAAGLVWTLQLRDGLRFHDGTKVLARDCVASIRRWAARDGFGLSLMQATDALDAPDDRTIRFRLRHPFPLLPNALGKISPNICAIMPQRLADLPADKPVPEIVGSGPFRFVNGEYVAGSRLVYERFADYVPAEGRPGLTSGAKVVHVDRVEWRIMPEAASAVAAVQTGEVDWMETPPPDLLPLLRKNRDLVVRVIDDTGVLPILRFNTLFAPFDTLAIRQAVLSAVQQKEFMEAFTSDATNYRTGIGVFTPGSPMASSAGLAETVGTRTVDQARQAIAAAGYKGERVMLMDPTDHPVNSVMAEVTADLFKKLGFNVDVVAMDAATMFRRRGSRLDLDHGGWSCFPAAIAGDGTLDPAVSFLTRGDGAKAWFGWPDDPNLEKLRAAWFAAGTLAQQKTIAQAMQRDMLGFAPYLPLGQILQPTVHRTALTGILPGFAKFWSVAKA